MAKKNIDYLGELRASVQDLAANPILFLPFVLEWLVFGLLTGVVVFVGLSIGFLALLTKLWIVIPAGFLLLAAAVALGSWFRAGQLGMIDAVTRRRQPDAPSFFSTARRAWTSLLLYTVLQTLIYALGFLPFAAFVIATIFDSLLRPWWLLLSLLTGLCFLAYAFLVNIALFFTQALIIRDGLGAWPAIRRSAALLREQPGTVIAAWGVSVLVSLSVAAVMSVLASITEWLGGAVYDIGIPVLSSVVQLCLTTTLLLYLFRVYGAVRARKR